MALSLGEVADQLRKLNDRNDANGRLALYEEVIVISAVKSDRSASPNNQPAASPSATGGETQRQGHVVSSNWTNLLATGVTDVWSRIRKSVSQLVVDTIAQEVTGPGHGLARKRVLFDQVFSRVLTQFDTSNGGKGGSASTWYRAEGLMLLLNAILKKELGSVMDPSLRHKLLSQFVLPFAFHLQVPVRELAHQFIVTSLLEGKGGWCDQGGESKEEGSDYKRMISSMCADLLPQHIGNEKDATSVAIVEGVLALRSKLQMDKAGPSAELSSTLNSLVGHDAAAVRHATAEYLCQSALHSLPPRGPQAGDLLTALLDLLEPVEAFISNSNAEEDGVKWEEQETRLMALYLFVMQLCRQATPVVGSRSSSSPPAGFSSTWPLPPLSLSVVVDFASTLLLYLENQRRFEPKRVAAQLLPFWMQLLAGLVATTKRRTMLKPFLDFRESNFLSGATPDHSNAALRSAAQTIDLFIALYRKVCHANVLLAPDEGLTFVSEIYTSGNDGRFSLTKGAWEDATANSKTEIPELLMGSVPDLGATAPISLLIDTLLPECWIPLIKQNRLSVSSHQHLLIHALKQATLHQSINEEGEDKEQRKDENHHHRFFSTFLLPEGKPPIFEDDMEGVGLGLYCMKLNANNLPEVVERSTSDDVSASAEGKKHIEVFFSELLSNSTVEPGVVSHLRAFALSYLKKEGRRDSFEGIMTSCVSLRLNAVCGTGWRTTTTTSEEDSAPKKASADDWDDSDDDEEDETVGGGQAGSPGLETGPVQGVSVAEEFSQAYKFSSQLLKACSVNDEDLSSSALRADLDLLRKFVVK